MLESETLSKQNIIKQTILYVEMFNGCKHYKNKTNLIIGQKVSLGTPRLMVY